MVCVEKKKTNLQPHVREEGPVPSPPHFLFEHIVLGGLDLFMLTCIIVYSVVAHFEVHNPFSGYLYFEEKRNIDQLGQSMSIIKPAKRRHIYWIYLF